MTGTHIQQIIITRFLIDPQADDQRVITVALGNNRSALRIVESVQVLHRLQGQELILFLGVSVSVSVSRNTASQERTVFVRHGFCLTRTFFFLDVS